MSQRVRCPACRTVMSVDVAVTGRSLVCTHCRAPIRIPEGKGEASPVPPPPPPPVRPSRTSWWWLLGPAAFLMFILRQFGCLSSRSEYDQVSQAFGGKGTTGTGDVFGTLLGLGLLVVLGVLIIGAIQKLISASQTAGSERPEPPSDSGQDSVPDRWWLAVAGQVSGPLTTDAVQASLRRREISLETQVCPVGTTRWQPLRAWPVFAGSR